MSQLKFIILIAINFLKFWFCRRIFEYTNGTLPVPQGKMVEVTTKNGETNFVEL